MDNTTLIVIVAVAVVVLILLAILFFVRQSRSRRSQEQRERARQEFGEEYEREARERGSEEEAESELRRRRGRIERQVRPLSDESRRRYEEQWSEVERVFVKNPERSIEMADRIVSDLLDERNFIADAAQDDRETERGLAAMHPEIAEDYREARRIRADAVARSVQGPDERGAEGFKGDDTTEDLRQAIRRYRTVYDQLMEE